MWCTVSLFSSASICFTPSFSLHLPPHVLALAITLHLHNPLFLSSNVIGIFEFHMLSGPFWFSFFPGTRFGAAPWEARCCFEQCRIRSRKGCFFFCGRIEMERRSWHWGGGNPAPQTGQTRASPMKVLEPRERQCHRKLKKRNSGKNTITVFWTALPITAASDMSGIFFFICSHSTRTKSSLVLLPHLSSSWSEDAVEESRLWQ